MTQGFHNNAIFWVEVDKIVPNPYQPRKDFDEDALQSLADSIKQYGVLQPLVVTRKEEQTADGGLKVHYELIAGERRLRAAKLAGLTQVPVLIRDKEDSDREKLELAIIENLQREDLNPIDKALAFRQLADKFKMTHAQIAKKVGKSREYVSNALRLLSLPEDIQRAIANGIISEGHARPLLMLADKPEEQNTLFKEITMQKLTVREAEHIARSVATDKVRKNHIPPEIRKIERELTENLGTRVRIEQKDGNVGRVHIDFTSKDDLEHLLNLVKAHQAHELAKVTPKLEDAAGNADNIVPDFEKTKNSEEREDASTNLGSALGADFAQSGPLNANTVEDQTNNEAVKDKTNSFLKNNFEGSSENVETQVSLSDSQPHAEIPNTEASNTAEQTSPESMSVNTQNYGANTEPGVDQNTTEYAQETNVQINEAEPPKEPEISKDLEELLKAEFHENTAGNDTETNQDSAELKQTENKDYYSPFPENNQAAFQNSTAQDSNENIYSTGAFADSTESFDATSYSNLSGNSEFKGVSESEEAPNFDALNSDGKINDTANQSLSENHENSATNSPSSEDSLNAFENKITEIINQEKSEKDLASKSQKPVYPSGAQSDIKLSPELENLEEQMQKDIGMIMQNPELSPGSVAEVKTMQSDTPLSDTKISGDAEIVGQVNQLMQNSASNDENTSDLGVTFNEYKEEQDTMPGFDGQTLTASQKASLANSTTENASFNADAVDIDSLVQEADKLAQQIEKTNTGNNTKDNDESDLYSVQNFS